MKWNNSFLILAFCLFFSCENPINVIPEKKEQPLISYVNPFIGTGGHGHTYPGATLPFGMMQLSPDTRLDGWDGCSGYHFSDHEIYGFSHTHLSGTGVSDYGDILLMPTNKPILNNGANGQEGYKSKFLHEKEVATPGFYSVHLEDTNIDVALTVSKRSGLHEYQFSSAENQFVILDLEHRDQLLKHQLEIISDTEIRGERTSKAWATDQRLFFYIKFSKPFTNSDRKYVKAPTKEAFEFINPNNEPIYVKIGISAVDMEGAQKNMEAEIGERSFETVKKEAQDTWEQQLEKVIVEGSNRDDKVNFYTSLYHTMIAPNLYQDVDGRYRGMDLKIHQTENFNYHTVFSLWDTYRAAHPLYTIIEQKRTNDFINTFLAKYDEGGIIPIWDLAGCYTGCMIGYHSVPVIADAYLKGIRGYDENKALEAMKHSAQQNHLGLASYKDFGFIPVEQESESVSKTLEYAYDDWTIAQMAKEMGNLEDYEVYTKRSQYYKNVYDPSSRFMRGRFRNTWFAPFDPYEVNFNYTEANSWQYSFYVPQDVSGFIKLMGGKRQLENQLDQLFSAGQETSGRDQADITGLIGQYAHGNEPSHHMAYLYNFVNKPHKTQERVRQILTELYTNAPDGISGNEDCGQMSAWYVFSSLGFYPVTPASNEYIIGAPLFDKATFQLENGNTFTILAKNNSKENKYIKTVQLNGREYNYSYLSHKDIMNGGTLIFEMTNQPSDWGTEDQFIPKTEISEHLIVPAPFIASGEIAFQESTTITLDCVEQDAELFYSLGGEFQKYESSISIHDKVSLQVYAQKDKKRSAIITTDFYKIDPNIKIKLDTEYANQYNAGGNNALIDGITGTQDFRTGTWQGYWNEDVIATVDLGQLKNISSVKLNFLKDQRSWIFLPTSVQILSSEDGERFIQLNEWIAPKPSQKEEVVIENISVNQNMKARYIRVIAKKLGVLPEWHLGYEHDGRSWIFIDEIQIK